MDKNAYPMKVYALTSNKYVGIALDIEDVFNSLCEDPSMNIRVFSNVPDAQAYLQAIFAVEQASSVWKTHTLPEIPDQRSFEPGKLYEKDSVNPQRLNYLIVRLSEEEPHHEL